MQSVVGSVLLASAALVVVHAAGEDTCMSVSTQDDTKMNQMGLLQKKHEKAQALMPSQTKAVPASGASASLDEDGYQILAGQCCLLEMIQFIRRVVEQQGFQVCNEGGLYGMAPFYTCQKGPSTFAQMVTDIATNRVSDCPWVGDLNADCPEPAEDCEEFPYEIPTDCGCSRGNSWNLDFNGATVTRSNLMGYGPETGLPEELRYTNIGAYNGQVLDLVVTGDGDYSPASNGSNGKAGGVFGNINVKGGHHVELTFTLTKTGTSTPVKVSELHFSLFDLDHTKTEKMLELIRVSGFYSYSVDLDTEFAVERDVDGRILFRSTHPGSGCDNPKNPETLGVVTCQAHGTTMVIDQRKRSFMMVYRDVSSWSIGVEITCNGANGDNDCDTGRNILFAGTSSLKDRCTA